MKNSEEDNLFFMSSVCKETYNSLPKIYGGYKDAKVSQQIKKPIVFRHKSHQCIEKEVEYKTNQKIISPKKRYCSTKSRYLSAQKGAKCTKKYCFCSLIHQQQPKELKKIQVISPKIAKIHLKPILYQLPEDSQSHHKVSLRYFTEPDGLIYLINSASINQSSRKSQNDFRTLRVYDDEIRGSKKINDGFQTKMKQDNNNQAKTTTPSKNSGYVTGTDMKIKNNNICDECSQKIQKIMNDTKPKNNNYIKCEQLEIKQNNKKNNNQLQIKQVSVAQIQVDLQKQQQQNIKQIILQTCNVFQTMLQKLNYDQISLRNKKNQIKYKKLLDNKKYKSFISQSQDNQNQKQIQQSIQKSISKSNSITTPNKSNSSSTISISQCVIKGQGNKLTQFKQLFGNQNRQNMKKIKVNSVKENGKFRVPTRSQYAGYLSSYKILDKNTFNLKQLIKKPLFTIVQQQQGQSVYFGEYKDDTKTGCGIYVSQLQIFQGVYQGDKKIKGCQRNIDGIYRGYFFNGKRQGYGIFQWNNGERFQGNWKEGLKCGFGVWRSPNGDWYQGQWYNNRQQGQGIYNHRNSVYTGRFKNFLKHGNGEQKFTNGDTYVGEYVEGKPNGKGKYKWSDGSIYEGEFKNGIRCGYGKLIQSNGNIYQGQFQDDFKHGRGKLQNANGQILQGTFKSGVFQNKLLSSESQSESLVKQ